MQYTMFTRMCICSTGSWYLGFAQTSDVSYLDDLLTRCGVLQATHSSGDANICRASICTYHQAQVSRIGDSSRRGNRPILASSPVDCLASSCYFSTFAVSVPTPSSHGHGLALGPIIGHSCSMHAFRARPCKTAAWSHVHA